LLSFIGDANNDRNAGQAGKARSLEASFAGDELVAPIRVRRKDNQWLKHAMLLNRIGEILQLCIITSVPRLSRVWKDQIGRDFEYTFPL
jgi:hypothetical protein